MAPTPTCLKVTVQSGKFPTCEAPFCRVTLGEVSYQTSTQPGNHPRWKTHFAFAFANEPALRFEVVDNNASVIGYVDIDLRALEASEEQQFRGKLDLKPVGSIRTSLQFYPRPAVKTELRQTAPQEEQQKDRPLLLAPCATDALASLWGDLAASQTTKHEPDPEFKIIIKDGGKLPSTQQCGKQRPQHRRSTGMQDNMLRYPGKTHYEDQNRRVSYDPQAISAIKCGSREEYQFKRHLSPAYPVSPPSSCGRLPDKIVREGSFQRHSDVNSRLLARLIEQEKGPAKKSREGRASRDSRDY